MLGDLFDFAKFHAKDAWSSIKDNPERMFLGAATPAGTKLWGGVLGKDWEPMVNPYGGATEDQFARADAQGLNTGPSRQVGGIADTIAGIWGGAGAMGGLGNAAASMSGGGGASGGLGGIYGQVDLGGQNGMGGLYTQADTGGLMAQGGGGGGLMDMIIQGQQLQGMLGGGQQQQQQPMQLQAIQQGAQTMQAPQIDPNAAYQQWIQSRNLPTMGVLGGMANGLR